jgi:hypothetical protein
VVLPAPRMQHAGLPHSSLQIEVAHLNRVIHRAGQTCCSTSLWLLIQHNAGLIMQPPQNWLAPHCHHHMHQCMRSGPRHMQTTPHRVPFRVIDATGASLRCQRQQQAGACVPHKCTAQHCASHNTVSHTAQQLTVVMLLELLPVQHSAPPHQDCQQPAMKKRVSPGAMQLHDCTRHWHQRHLMVPAVLQADPAAP